MAFFDSLDNDRKRQIAESRLIGLQEQLFGMMLSAGIDPDSFDIETFNPETEVSSEHAGLRLPIAQTISAIETAQSVLSRVVG
jgi:hypothetical protein